MKNFPLVLATIITSCTPTLAPAQENFCAPREMVVQRLQNEHKEYQIGVGVGPQKASVLELFVAEDGSTWTLLVTKANGVSCIVGYGTDWSILEPKKINPPA